MTIEERLANVQHIMDEKNFDALPAALATFSGEEDAIAPQLVAALRNSLLNNEENSFVSWFSQSVSQIDRDLIVKIINQPVQEETEYQTFLHYIASLVGNAFNTDEDAENTVNLDVLRNLLQAFHHAPDGVYIAVMREDPASRTIFSHLFPGGDFQFSKPLGDLFDLIWGLIEPESFVAALASAEYLSPCFEWLSLFYCGNYLSIAQCELMMRNISDQVRAEIQRKIEHQLDSTLPTDYFGCEGYNFLHYILIFAPDKLNFVLDRILTEVLALALLKQDVDEGSSLCVEGLTVDMLRTLFDFFAEDYRIEFFELFLIPMVSSDELCNNNSPLEYYKSRDKVERIEGETNQYAQILALIRKKLLEMPSERLSRDMLIKFMAQGNDAISTYAGNILKYCSPKVNAAGERDDFVRPAVPLGRIARAARSGDKRLAGDEGRGSAKRVKRGERDRVDIFSPAPVATAQAARANNTGDTNTPSSGQLRPC